MFCSCCWGVILLLKPLVRHSDVTLTSSRFRIRMWLLFLFLFDSLLLCLYTIRYSPFSTNLYRTLFRSTLSYATLSYSTLLTLLYFTALALSMQIYSASSTSAVASMPWRGTLGDSNGSILPPLSCYAPIYNPTFFCI